MIVFRVGKTQYAKDIDGIGAKLFGGRWNHQGIPCIYTASSRALAILEYSVNINIEFVPRALSITTFEIDEKLIEEIERKNLPGNWFDTPAPTSTKDFGTELLQSGIPIVRFPSCVVPEEYNYVLNPSFTEKKFMKIVEIKDCIYDVRIKIN